MKLAFKILLFSLVTIFSFTSCERVIETDVGMTVRKLVINSNFTADNQIKVVLTANRTFNTAQSENEYITNGTVELYEDDQLLEELIINDNGHHAPVYTTINFTPEIGVVYTIIAKAPGFETASASSFIPKSAAVDNINFNNQIENSGDGIKAVNFTINLNMQDENEEENYYHLVMRQRLSTYEVSQNSDGTSDTTYDFNSTMVDLEVALQNDFPHTILPETNESILLTDETFDGQNVLIQLSGRFKFDSQLYVPGSLSIEIRTVSQAYYDYYYSVYNQNGGIATGRPIDINPVVDNIRNGKGIFAGYNNHIIAINP